MRSSPSTPPCACGASAPSAKTIGTSARSSNSSIAKAERPTGLAVPTSGSTTAVDDKASAMPSAKAAIQPCAGRWMPTPISSAETEQLGRADAEHQPPHPPQPPERQLQPDREEQQDDAELGERLDRVGVGDGDIVEPGQPGRPARPSPNGPTRMPIRMKPMTGLIRIRAKAGMTIPAAPRMTSASLRPEVLNSPCVILPLCSERGAIVSRMATEIAIF